MYLYIFLIPGVVFEIVMEGVQVWKFRSKGALQGEEGQINIGLVSAPGTQKKICLANLYYNYCPLMVTQSHSTLPKSA